MDGTAGKLLCRGDFYYTPLLFQAGLISLSWGAQMDTDTRAHTRTRRHMQQKKSSSWADGIPGGGTQSEGELGPQSGTEFDKSRYGQNVAVSLKP